MQRRIDKLENHFIVCGYGRVGRAVARELESEHASFSVVEREEDLVEQMEADGVPHVRRRDARARTASSGRGARARPGLRRGLGRDERVHRARRARTQSRAFHRRPRLGAGIGPAAAGGGRRPGRLTVRVQWPAHGPRRDASAVRAMSWSSRRRTPPRSSWSRSGSSRAAVRRPGGARRLRRGARARRPSRRRPDHREPATRCEAPGGGHRASARGGGPHLGRPVAASRGPSRPDGSAVPRRAGTSGGDSAIDHASQDRPRDREQEHVHGGERTEIGFGAARDRDPRDHDRELAASDQADGRTGSTARADTRPPPGEPPREGLGDASDQREAGRGQRLRDRPRGRPGTRRTGRRCRRRRIAAGPAETGRGRPQGPRRRSRPGRRPRPPRRSAPGSRPR